MVFLTIVNFFSFWGAELFMAPFFLLFLWGGVAKFFIFWVEGVAPNFPPPFC